MSFHLRKPSSILTRIHSHILSRNRIKNFSSKRATLVEEYEPIIGLEVHAQLNTKSKLFSDAGSQFNARPNSQVASFDLSLPGSLPRLNQSAVIDAIRSGLALNCRIPEKSSFDRKHYFYADLPNGYQITQQREPIARDGYIDFIVYDDFHHTIGIQNPSAKIEPQLKRCYLKQIQLEQDSGKSLVDSEESLIDLNRAGLPLLEFVFEPELQSTLEATSLVRELIQILQLLKACTCRMELGALRVDANISVRPRGESKLGTRTEVKNLNSFRFLREAIEYEIQRQIQVLKSGGRVINETMGWDFRTKQTHSMRDKEIVQDYRFLPEPNLPPIFVGNCSMEPSLVESSKQSINIRPFIEEIESLNLPSKIRQQLEEECELSLQETHFLVANSELRELFLELFRNSEFKDGAFIFDIVFKLTNGLLDLTLEPLSIEVIRSKISVENFGEILALLHSGVISQQTSVDIVRLYQQGIQNKTPNEIVAEFNWSLVNDPVEIERICRIVVKELPKVAKKFAKSGERKPRSMLIQKAQLALGNRANEDQLWVVFEKILRPSSKL